MTRQHQLTIRFDRELDARIRKLAHEEDLSLNEAAVRLLRRGAGLESGAAPDVIGHSLDRFFGTWSQEQADEVMKANEDFEKIDPDLWK